MQHTIQQVQRQSPQLTDVRKFDGSIV